MGTRLPDADVSDPPSRRSQATLRIGVLVSLLLHGFAALWWSQLPETVLLVLPEQAVLELTLEPLNSFSAPLEASVAEVLTPDPEPVEELARVESVEPENEPDQVVQIQVAERLPESAPASQPPPLKLDRTANWEKHLEAEEGAIAIAALPLERLEFDAVGRAVAD